ncbi:MAG: hydroxyacylglutathione hydrolase [Proteobacteria bacterium]|nr:hydroxyacylglutathione hydrolase [Pseudomonadota bacterium]
MNLVALPAFADNYIWMLHDGAGALVVDPGDAAPVRAALGAHGLELTGILVTHHHPDHVGGLNGLQPLLNGAPVYAPQREQAAMPVPTTPVAGGDCLTWQGKAIRVLDVPGHTAGHVAYVLDDLLFCGDTLFSAGCGRLFEGTADQMHRSLQQLGALPGTTRVCCAHEYTLANLRFARQAEPDNAAVARHEAACLAQRAAGQPTLPSTIALEWQINPFLRAPDAQRLGELREWKNRC